MAERNRNDRPAPEKQIILVAGGKQLTRKQWRRFEQVGLRPELDLDELVMNWSEKKVRDLGARGAITAITIESTLEAAPTVTMTLRDPDRVLFRRRAGRVKKRKRSRGAGPVQVDEGWDPILPPDVLGQPMQVSLDGVTYQLVKATYQQGSGELSLVFEHELVYLLKRHKGSKRARREKVTRAQFILSLVKELEPEVRKRRYRFVCPELNVRQKIDGGRKQTGTVVTSHSDGGTRSSGGGGRNLDRIFPAHKLGEDGFRMTKQEVRACAAAGGFWGKELDAMVALCEGEGLRYPGIINFIGAIGLWQMYPAGWGAEGIGWMNDLGGEKAMRNPIQNAKMARKLYVNAGKTYSGQWEFQIPYSGGPGNGQPTRAEARELAATVTGEGSNEGGASSRTVTETRSYQFARGRKESSWTAITRLAGEVKWRAFVVGNTVYYMSEEQLYGRRARYEIEPDHDGVIDLSYDVDWGKTVSEASLQVTLARWQAPPGSVVLLDGFGPPDGRWLVSTISRDYFQPTAEVKLVQPAKELLEPANEQTSRTERTGGDGDGGGDDAPSGKLTSPWPGKASLGDGFGLFPGHASPMHHGADCGMAVGTKCIAPFDGEITLVLPSGFGLEGGMVHLRAGADVGTHVKRGDKIGWGHCVSARVNVGQKVKAGHWVAKSNYYSSPHVHFVLIKGGSGTDGNADPVPFLRRVGAV